MLQQTPLSDAQQQYLNETLERAGSFEELIRVKGWEHVLTYYQNKVQQLTTSMLTSEKPLSEFEAERREIMGIRNLINHINSDLKVLEDERAKRADISAKES